jgi:hypothetical protein
MAPANMNAERMFTAPVSLMLLNDSYIPEAKGSTHHIQNLEYHPHCTPNWRV